MSGLLGEIRDIRRTVQEVGRTAQSLARAGADITGADDTYRSQDARYRTRSYNDRHRADIARDRYEDYRALRDDRRDDRDRDDRRGDFIRDPRRAGLGSGQPRGDDRAAPVTRDATLEATVNFVDRMEVAANSYGPARTAALREARAILDDPASGLKLVDGSIHFPTVAVPVANGEEVRFEMQDRDYRNYPNADAAMAQLANAMRVNRIGDITQADLSAAAPAAATTTLQVGTGTSAPEGTGTPAPAAPIATAFTLPPASGPEAQIYTRNRAGRTMNADDAPKMSANQVEAIQRELGVQADGKWGPDTQAAFARAAQAAGVNPRDVDFTNPNDPETVRVLSQFNAPAAAVAPQAAPQVAAGGSPAPAVTTDAPAAPDAARMTAAVTILNNLAGDDRTLSANEIATHGQNAEFKPRIGRAFDLNNNGRVEDTELNQIVAAAAAKPEAERVTVAGGVAALNPLFAGTSFASVQPTTDVASVTPPAPGLAQTAQVSPQTGEVTPPAAAPASAPPRTENAVYVVPEPTFEPSSQGVPTAQGFVRGGGVTIA